jgi:hypothetical protein
MKVVHSSKPFRFQPTAHPVPTEHPPKTVSRLAQIGHERRYKDARTRIFSAKRSMVNALESCDRLDRMFRDSEEKGPSVKEAALEKELELMRVRAEKLAQRMALLEKLLEVRSLGQIQKGQLKVSAFRAQLKPETRRLLDEIDRLDY